MALFLYDEASNRMFLSLFYYMVHLIGV